MRLQSERRLARFQAPREVDRWGKIEEMGCDADPSREATRLSRHGLATKVTATNHMIAPSATASSVFSLSLRGNTVADNRDDVRKIIATLYNRLLLRAPDKSGLEQYDRLIARRARGFSNDCPIATSCTPTRATIRTPPANRSGIAALGVISRLRSAADGKTRSCRSTIATATPSSACSAA